MAWKIVLMFAVMMGTAHSISTADIINKPQDSKPHSEPMVAVSCSGGLSSPEQYTLQYSSLSKDSSPWQQDLTTTGCITDKLEILKHCQRLFPSKDITNIVESNKVKVNTVCRVNKNIKSKSNKVKCGKSLNVNTVVFRCLESPFQSDALLVPSPCIFDHIHNASTCWESGAWNLTAYKSCTQRGEDFSLKSYAVLLPCGVGLFTGVEFVCCPGNNKISNNNNNNNKKVKETEAYDEYDDEEEDDEEEDEDDDDYLDYFEKATSTSTTTTTTTTTTPAPSSDPQVDVYFRSPYDNSFNEHANFKQAENRLENLHRLRMSKVMRDWEELEKKYQEMRKSDETIEDAEEFKRTVTLRFQKTIKNLEEEGQAEKRQLLAVHQQRVLTHINERKKEAMECYTQSLNEGQNANKIRKCLEKLMRILHKDRHHTLAHFKHLLKSNPKQSQVEQEYTLQRLTQISQTARQALKMLARYPSLNNQLRAPLEDYVLGLQGRDDPPSSLLTATHETEQLLLEKYEQQMSHGNNKIDNNEEISTNQPSSTPIVATSTSSSTFSDLTTPTITTTVASGDENNSDEALEDNVIDKHLKRNEFTHDQIISVRREVYHRESRPIYFTMAFAGIALLGAVFIGLVVLVKRRVIDHPRNHGFLEVNTGPSNIHAGSLLAPEEKHVANMQINGYENPTYKYFETTATTANT